MSITKLFLPLILLTLTGCANSHDPLVSNLEEEINLAFGQQVLIRGEGVVIRFSDVLEDSRCPVDVQCIWAGNAKVALTINNSDLQLNTYLDPRKSRRAGYMIELNSLDPQPLAGEVIKKEEYVITFTVSGSQD